MSQLPQAITDGILGGAVYALMAAGLTLIFGVLDIINIAQGILVVLAAYLSYALSVHLHIDLLAGLLITIPSMFLLGLFIEWALMRRLRGRERTAMSLLVSYAVAVIIEGSLYQIFGVTQVSLQAWYITASVHIFGFYLADIYLIGFGLAAVILTAIYVTLYRTKFGRSVRATMQDRTAARLVGINVDRVSGLTFGIGVAVTAAGGMVFGATNVFNADSGYDLISRLLAIVILGGLGSIGGALAAALIMVTGEEIVNIWAPTWSTAVFYAALVIVLVVRPEGLLGKRAVRAQ
jgi:branched-chain amino acid transport system permease protein